MMSTSDKDFSPAESLQLIRSMIETTKTSISDKSHFFLLWGWATLVGCLLQYYLSVIANYPRHYYAWFVTPVALLLHFIFIHKYKKEDRVKTFIGEAMGFIWFIIGISYLALAIVFSKIGWQYCFPFYILLYGIGTYISGSLLKCKPMKIGGGICLVLVAIAPFLHYSLQMLLAAFAILISYIIPGHLLRNQYRKQKI
ncbi:hypothetical protein [Segetibacter sp.]|jgi:hypothetical protein|uniref:hypothetical protein n=1 Tax=Segetibacter sp. TaxID=2231182 RepID=UPI002611836A|nr:hypothetical protein [Segetibacter sp.]MCW3079634.1 hypothetical protein [Segetibacter sp.]